MQMRGAKFWTNILSPSPTLSPFFIFWHSLPPLRAVSLPPFVSFSFPLVSSLLLSAFADQDRSRDASSIRVACNLWRSWSFANLPVSRENLREVTKRKEEEEEEEENSRAERIVPYSSHMRLVVYIGLHN